MKLNHCLSSIIFAWMLSISFAQKKILFTKVQCPVKSNKVTKVECFLEGSKGLTVQFTTTNNEMANIVGISDITVYMYGKNGNAMTFSGIRIDVCNLHSGSRQTLLAMLQKGIQQTDNNLPKKCPFLRNTTYVLRHMKFDASFLPVYLPEYNCTYIGKFQTNNEILFVVRVECAVCDIKNDCSGKASDLI